MTTKNFVATTVLSLIVLWIAGCQSATTPPPTKTETELKAVDAHVQTAWDALSKAIEQLNKMPAQQYKEAALAHLNTAVTALKNAFPHIKAAQGQAASDAKTIAAANDESVKSLRGWGIWFCVLGIFPLVGGIILSAKLGSLARYVIGLGAAAVVAGVALILLASLITTMLGLVKGIAIAIGIIIATVALIGLWHFIVYMRRGSPVLDSAKNAFCDLTQGQIQPDAK